MAVLTADHLLERVKHLGLLESDRLEELNSSLAEQFPEPIDLARELVQRDWLTAYQTQQLFDGRDCDLVLGSYILLDRLGQGGMGQIFKARHRQRDRVVALKVIHEGRIEDETTLRRFLREGKIAASLVHPNVVRGYEADHVEDKHFFTMEFVEGTDLFVLVKKKGPLPIATACDYVRQAALGLQYAFESGLVHRDIKPANLLLDTKQNVVKLLDLGLARRDRAEGAEAGTALTVEGSMLGTPDFIAPEQALDARAVDIRADLYSLGCTLYYLLSGKVPFPEGTLTEKLLKHLIDVPQPLKELRPDVPSAVAAVVTRLMNRQPEDRYQTPAEVASALAALGLVAETPGPAPGAGAAPLSSPSLPTPPGASLGGRTVPGRALQRALQQHLAAAGKEGGVEANPRPSQSKLPTTPLPKSRVVPAVTSVPPVAANTPRSPFILGSLVVGLIGFAVIVWQLWSRNSNRPEQDGRIPGNGIIQPTPETVCLETPEQAVAALRKLGATIGLEESQPGKPVVEVRFADKPIMDADLVPLQLLTQLRTLDLTGTKVSDAGLAAIKGLKHLRKLVLRQTAVGDVGLAHLYDLSALRELDLHGTKVSDAGLVHLQGFTQLEELDLSRTSVDGSGLKHFANLTRLRYLVLIDTRVSDPELKHLAALTQLEELHLTGTKVNGSGLLHLKGLGRLTVLTLSGTSVRDAALENLIGYSQLVQLGLNATPVTDAGLAHLKNLASLRRLDLRNTEVSDAGLARLYSCSHLEELRLGGTKVSEMGIRDLQKALPKLKIEP